ncbi:Hypothetical protein A7982_05599 [Minicystis rosea]|nr:Hypothetical protein A7982_05599 [Minicystis rosea]
MWESAALFGHLVKRTFRAGARRGPRRALGGTRARSRKSAIKCA